MFSYRVGIVVFRVPLQCLLDFANVVKVAPTPEVGASTVLLLLIIGNYKIPSWYGLQCNNHISIISVYLKYTEVKYYYYYY